jgi:hypothetical protein
MISIKVTPHPLSRIPSPSSILRHLMLISKVYILKKRRNGGLHSIFFKPFF